MWINQKATSSRFGKCVRDRVCGWVDGSVYLRGGEDKRLRGTRALPAVDSHSLRGGRHLVGSRRGLSQRAVERNIAIEIDSARRLIYRTRRPGQLRGQKDTQRGKKLNSACGCVTCRGAVERGGELGSDRCLWSSLLRSRGLCRRRRCTLASRPRGDVGGAGRDGAGGLCRRRNCRASEV